MVLILVGALILVLLLTKIKIKLNLKNKDLKINIIFFSVIKIKIKAKTKKDKKGNLNVILKAKSVGKGKFDIKSILNFMLESIDSIRYLLSRVILKIDADCIFYLFSPDKTAIMYGAINSIIYNIHMVLIKELKEYKGEYNIKPDFNNKKNNINIETIFTIRNIYIVLFIFKILPLLLKYRKIFKNKGGGLNESSNRRLDENYNG